MGFQQKKCFPNGKHYKKPSMDEENGSNFKHVPVGGEAKTF